MSGKEHICVPPISTKLSDGAMMTPKMQYILPYNLHLEWLISSNWEKVITFCKALHPNASPTVRPR